MSVAVMTTDRTIHSPPAEEGGVARHVVSPEDKKRCEDVELQVARLYIDIGYREQTAANKARRATQQVDQEAAGEKIVKEF